MFEAGQVLGVEVELDLVAPGEDRLDRALQRGVTELELQQHVDEEAASVAEVLEQVHVKADAAMLEKAPEVAEDHLVDHAARIGVALTGDRGFGIDREPEREPRLLHRDRWRRHAPLPENPLEVDGFLLPRAQHGEM